MSENRNTPGERRWRWTLRIVGLSLLAWSATLYTINGEVLVVWPAIAAWCIGADSLRGIQILRQRDGNGG